MPSSQHVYEIHPRKYKRGVDLISDVLPFGRLWYGEPDAVSSAIGYAKFYSRSHDALIRVYDGAGNVILVTLQHFFNFAGCLSGFRHFRCRLRALLRRGGQGRVDLGARFREAVWLCLDSGAFAKPKDSLPLRDKLHAPLLVANYRHLNCSVHFNAVVLLARR
jgi:hypothetical protein